MDGAVRPRHKGFSLAEYLFALGLLAVVALTLLGVFARGNQLIQKSGEVSTADELASSIIEDIKMSVSEEGIGALPARPFVFDGVQGDSQISLTSSVFPPTPYPQKKLGPQTYSIRVEGKEESDKLTLIEVTVGWNETSKVTLSTLVYPRE